MRSETWNDYPEGGRGAPRICPQCRSYVDHLGECLDCAIEGQRAAVDDLMDRLERGCMRGIGFVSIEKSRRGARWTR